MTKKNKNDLNSDHLVVFGIISVVLFLLVIAITSKHINSNEETVNNNKNNFYQNQIYFEEQKTPMLNLIKESIVIKEIKNHEDNRYYWDPDEVLGFLYFSKEINRLKDNWEYKTNAN